MRVLIRWCMLSAVLLAVGFTAACGSGDGESSATTTGGATTSDGEGTASSGASKEVRVLHLAPTNAGLWDAMHEKAYQAVAGPYGWDVQKAEGVSYGETDAVLSRWGDTKVDLVMATDSGYGPSMLKAAEKYPDTKWVLLSNLAGEKSLPANFAAYSMNWCDYGYLAGVTAGLVGTKKAAAITGMRIPASDQWDATFAQGVKDANPNLDAVVKKVGDWTDPGHAAETASAVIADGADVIWDMHSINAPIAQRAQDEGVWYVGSNLPSGYGPKVHVATIIGRYDTVDKVIAEQLKAGSFESKLSTNGVKEGLLDVTPLKLGFEDEQAKLDEFKQRLADGEVTYDAKVCQTQP